MILRRTRPIVVPKKLSEELEDLRLQFGEHAVKLRTVLYVLRGRAYMLVVILLCLPFLLPVPLFGLSTPFGMAIVLISLRMALGQRPWLPMKIQRLDIPPGFFPKVIALAAKIIRAMERFLRPRWLVLTESGVILQLHAVAMVMAASILLLPLPIPFSNGLPAWGIIFFAGGLLERDGVFIVFGYLMLAATGVYLWLFGEAANQLVHSLWAWWHG